MKNKQRTELLFPLIRTLQNNITCITNNINYNIYKVRNSKIIHKFVIVEIKSSFIKFLLRIMKFVRIILVSMVFILEIRCAPVNDYEKVADYRQYYRHIKSDEKTPFTKIVDNHQSAKNDISPKEVFKDQLVSKKITKYF